MGSPIRRIGIAAGVTALVAAGCARSGPEVGPIEAGDGPSPETTAGSPVAAPARVDPREDGFEVGFGEFAVTLEAAAIRPGPVTFVVHNGGELVHGFEMAIEGEDS